MADSRSVFVTDALGAPLTSGSPTFPVYADKATGAARTPPAVPVHLGAGVWGFTASDADESVGTVAVVDFGAGAEPRRVTFAIHKPDNQNQFFAWHVEDEAGAEWTGAAPTLGLYDDSAGNARTPPAIVTVAGAWVFSLTPTAADVTARTEGFIAGPAGSSVQGWGLSTVPFSPFAFASLVDNPARSLASYVAGLGALNLETPPGGTQALTFAAGGNLTAGPMRAAEGLVGEFHVSILNSGGPLTPYMGTPGAVGSLYESAASVIVRSQVDSYSQGEAVARAVLRRCHLAELAGYVSCVVRDAEPIYQGLDENGHHRFVFSVDLTIKR